MLIHAHPLAFCRETCCVTEAKIDCSIHKAHTKAKFSAKELKFFTLAGVADDNPSEGQHGGGSSAASVSGPTDQSTQQKSASRSDRSPGACIVPLAVLFSRFPLDLAITRCKGNEREDRAAIRVNIESVCNKSP